MKAADYKTEINHPQLSMPVPVYTYESSTPLHKRTTPPGEAVEVHYQSNPDLYISDKITFNTLTDETTIDEAITDLISKHGNKGRFWAVVREF